MNEAKRQKLKAFANDQGMTSAVYEVLLNTFIKKRDGDVQSLAAQKIAIDMLQDAWRDIKRYSSDDVKRDVGSFNVGL